MDNPEKRTSYGTQEEDKQTKTKKQTNKHTTQYVFDITIRKQTQIRQIRHDPSYKQLEIKTKRTSFLYVSYKQIAYMNFYCNIIK